jgi:hypothetical protein
VACCRRAWHRLDTAARAAVEVWEQFADGAAGLEELQAALWANVTTSDLALRNAVDQATVAAWRLAVATLAAVASCLPDPGVGQEGETTPAQEQAAQADLLRDTIPGPARPTPAEPFWRTPAVVALGHAAYDDRILPAGHLDPDRLAVLADALEEAGCDDDALLGHLRRRGPHVRGCWAVDAVLGGG